MTDNTEFEGNDSQHKMSLSRTGQATILVLSEKRLGIFQSAVAAVQSLKNHMHGADTQDLDRLKQKFTTAAGTDHRVTPLIPLSYNESKSLVNVLQAADQHRNHELRYNTDLPDQSEMHLISEDFRKQHENIYPPTMQHLDLVINGA